MSRDTGFPTWRLVAGAAVTGCLLLSFAWAADQGTGGAAYSWQKEIVARVGAVQGDTKVQRAGEAKFKKIAVKAPLYVMDFLATGKNSKLWWQGTFNAFTPSDKWKPGPDVTHGSLGADSVFGFKQFTRAGASYRFVGYVQKGTVRFIKTLPNTNPPSTFTIGTHTAWIEVLPSDRAADFIVESKNESLTTVTLLWGKVRVRNVSPEIKESRILTSCQEVDVERDQEPGEIKWVSTDTMKELVKRTTIPKTLPEDVPACERLKTEVILDLTEVYLPPAGVALFPVVPVPVPVPGDKPECCPPGKIYDPRTGKCVCQCPEGERPPVIVLGTNGSTGNGLIGPIGPGPCGSCRRGATFNPQTCTCECPCPQGFLLPGQGCVPQCPAGYSEAYDSSNSPPYRCPYCLPTGVVVDPVPPPLRQCRNREQCDGCEGCIDGTCLPRVCRTGFYLDRVSCTCLPVINNIDRPCAADAECSLCQKCVNGQCQQAVTCPDQQRLNTETCQCVSENGTDLVEPRALTEEPHCLNNSDCPRCQTCSSGSCVQRLCPVGQRMNPDTCQCEAPCLNNRECPLGEICRKGKCVKKPPPRPRPTVQEESVELPSLLEDSSGQGIPSGGIGIGGGGIGGGPSGGVQRVPRQIAPVQRIPRTPSPKPR
jgi:hypothetical protein